MIVAERRNKIKEILFDRQSVKVSELVSLFDVSEETIRRDLNQLEREGLIHKIYGGAVLVDELREAVQFIPPVQQRKVEYRDEKDAIGKEASKIVRDGQIIILDAGSTVWFVAKHLKGVKDLTIVTNSIDIAQECSMLDTAEIFLVGGKLQQKSMSLVGPQAQIEFQKYNADIVFLGASGISQRKGFTSSDIYEAEIKRSMLAAGQKVVVVADHSKFERQALISFAQFQDVDMFVTSDRADEMMLESIGRENVEVVVCPTDTNDMKEGV